MGNLFNRQETAMTYTWPETRTQRLNRILLEVEPGLCVERARLVTESYKETEGEPQIVRRSKALDKVLSEMTIFIQDEQMVVGNQASQLRWAPVFPETEANYIIREIDLFPTRENDRVTVSPDVKKELLEDILPYWVGKNTEDIAWRRIPAETVKVMKAKHPLFHAEIHLSGSFGHVIVNNRMLLEMGFGGLRKEAEQKLAALELTDPDALRKSHFYQAEIILTTAMSKFVRRYVALAREMARTETREKRKKELELIAVTCEAIAEGPAHTFMEAVQLFWFANLMLYIEQDGLANSPGRIDQFLYPYYRHDIDAGLLTDEDVLQILELLWIKFTEIMRAYDYASAFYYGGFSISENVLLGGLTADGRDATNELSYLCLDAEAATKLSQPNLSVRIHADTPEDFLLKACELVVKGRTKPQFFNDTIGIQMLLNSGVPLPEARAYNIAGCVEPVPDNAIGLSNAAMSNLGKAMELALNNGKCMLCGEQMGPATGDPTQFKSFADVLEAFKVQVDTYVRHMVTALNVIQAVHAEVYPLPFFSLLLADCMDRGMDCTWGGARYNFTGPQGVGVANVADSLSAIDTLVFKQKAFSMADLVKALAANFEGYEDMRQTLIRKAPKYGSDDAYADKMMRLVGQTFSEAVNQYRDPRGGRYRAGLYSVPANVPLGMNVAALPDGRLATTPLTDGISPRHGAEKAGITGVLKSAAKVDHVLACNGTSLNVRLEMR